MNSARMWGWMAFAVGALIVASLCFRLDYLPLYEPDEARYAEVSREMNETGQFLIPQLNYEPRIKKPALFQWLVAGSQRLFPSFDAASRAPSVVAGILMLVTLGWVGQRLWPRGRSAVVLVGVQGTMLLFWMMARMAMVDLWMAWCVTVAILGLYGWKSRPGRQGLFWLAGLAMALGFNFKGPIALAVPLVVFWLHAAWRGEARSLWAAAPWVWWLGASVVLSLPWFVAVIWHQGHDAAGYFLGSEVIGRFLGAGESRAKGLFYYVGILPLVILPWTGWIWLGLRRMIPELRAEGFRRWAQARPGESLGLCWWVGGALFLSLSSGKMIQYTLPLIPGLALWIAYHVDREAGLTQPQAGFPWAGFGILTAIMAGFLILGNQEILRGAGLLAGSAGVLLIVTLLPVFSARWRSFRAVLSMVLLSLMIYQGIQMALTDLPRLWKSRRDFGRLAQPYVRPGVKVLIHGQVPHSVLTEVRVPVNEVDPWEAITAFAGPEPVILLGRCPEIRHFNTILRLPPYRSMNIEITAIEAENGVYAVAFNRAYVERFGPPVGKPLD